VLGFPRLRTHYNSVNPLNPVVMKFVNEHKAINHGVHRGHWVLDPRGKIIQQKATL